MPKQTLLFAAADERRVDPIRRLLDHTDLDVQLSTVFSWEAAQEALLSGSHDLYLLDQALVADRNASWAMLADAWQSRRWLLMLDDEDPEQVEAALRAGAADFLIRDTLDQQQLDRALRYAAARSPRPHQQARDVMQRIRGALKQAREKLTKQKALAVLHEEIVHFASREATTPKMVLKVALDAVCTYTGWPVGHVYLVREGTLVSSTLWHYEDPRVFAALYKATRDTTFSPGDGSLPGRVFDRGEAVWIQDLEADPHGLRLPSGQDLGVKAAFGFPALMDETVVAVLEFYATTVQPVDALLLDSIEAIGIQIGRVFERARAKKALQESGDRLRTFTETTAEAVITADPQGRIVDWNRGAARIFGYRAAEAIGQPLTMVMATPHQAAYQAELARFQENGASRLIGKTTEIEGVRHGGETFPIEVSLASWQVGKASYFGGIIRDITARKKALKAAQESQALLRESEERFMLAVRGSHSGIWDWPDVHKDEAWWSPRFYELLGYDDGEIEASFSQLEALLHPEDRARTFELLQAHFEERTPFDIEYRLRTKTGAYRWFHARGEALRDSQGHAVRMAGSLTDVDERKHAEAAVRQSREQLRQLAARLADVREQERTRLSREVHDVLGQTLTVLQMNVAMIEKGLTEEQQALHDRIAVMKQAINETVRTVRRIAHELRPGILDDLGVLAAIEWETQRFASRTDIACTFVDDVEDLDLDPKRSTTVFRVFQEIMTNVARHAEATEVVVTATQRNGCLTLIVQDNGRGIREEELKNTTSLGLLGMRERLFPWGGHVDFAGAPNEGTTVTVTLPLSHLQPAM